jgi:3-dehydroquinate synthase
MNKDIKITSVSVALSAAPYKVLIGHDILSQAGELSATVMTPCRCAVVSDDCVPQRHSQKLLDALTASGFTPALLTIPAGEASKSMAMAAELCDRLIDLGLDRKSALFALGGGVIGDLSGFVASIYFRGIPIVQVPTTVVAQVDSSIGGKTGVNSPRGKNLIGSFHQPRLVIADTATLATLPDRIFHEGLAEIVKHAVIADAAMLDMLPPDRSSDLSDLIARNASIKGRIVAEDEFETKGRRALLNFGHTIGHAVEAVAGYGTFSHGEAIAIGTIAALDLSVRLAGLPEASAAHVRSVIKSCALPTSLPSSLADTLTTDRILAALGRDKKFHDGSIRFVLTNQLGSAFLSNCVTWEDITGAIERLREK